MYEYMDIWILLSLFTTQAVRTVQTNIQTDRQMQIQ